jgi:hypothetical protein
MVNVKCAARFLFLALGSALYAGGGGETAPKPDVDRAAPAVEVAQSAPAAPAHPFYIGDGGKGASITILAPEARGLAEDQDYLPQLVQGEFMSNFSGYSGVSVFDRMNLDKIYEEQLSGYYSDEDAAGLDLGRLTSTDYIMNGSITKTATGYALQIQVTRNEGKMTAASYSGTCTFAELDNLTGVRRASLDLLQKLGVEPTERTRRELGGAARPQAVMAQTADAKGYTADRSGRTAEAAIYYAQAAAIDPTMLQTASRASVLTATIASGSLGAGTRDLIQQRKDWIALLAETEETLYNLIGSASSPPYALYYSTDIKWGNINYQTESRDARFETNLRGLGYWFDSVRAAAQSVYGAVYDGLNKTGRKNEWGLGNWPGSGVTQKNPFATAWRHDINVVFELVNVQGKAIGRQTYSRRAEYSPRRDGNQISIAYNADNFATVVFNTVKAEDITDRLAIRVASVNGADTQTSSPPLRVAALSDVEWAASRTLAPRYSQGAISGRNEKLSGSLTISAEIWGEPVASIGDYAFMGINRITLFLDKFIIVYFSGYDVMPSWNVGVSEGIFFGNQLTSVTIPNGVTSIGQGVFTGNQLTSAIIPDSVTSIGKAAFANNRLTSVTIGNGVTSIGDYAFANNDLPSVTIGNDVTSIGSYAFFRNQLTSVVIPGSVRSIGGGAFAKNQLTSVTIGNGVTSIGLEAFAGNQLTSVVIPDSVRSIGGSAFDSNTTQQGSYLSPTSITIGADVSIYGDRNPNFFQSFITSYNKNGKKAGNYTYKKDGTTFYWRFTPR